MSLYVLLPIATGVHTTKPAETLKNFFWYSGPLLPTFFPDLEPSSSCNLHRAYLHRIDLRTTLPTQRHAVPRGRTSVAVPILCSASVRDRGIGSSGFKGHHSLRQQLNPILAITRSPDHPILFRASVVGLFLICAFLRNLRRKGLSFSQSPDSSGLPRVSITEVTALIRNQLKIGY